MTTAVAHVHLEQTGSLAAESIQHLAQTFEHAHPAVWIHDSAGRCVYRNLAARRSSPAGCEDLGDILDYQDRRVGVLRIRAF